MGRPRKSPKALSKEIESLALKTVLLDAKDIPSLGEVLKALEKIEDLAIPYGDGLLPLVKAMKDHLEKVILGEKTELSPFEEGVAALQNLCTDLGRKKPKTLDVQPLLDRLSEEGDKNEGGGGKTPAEKPAEESSHGIHEAEVTKQGEDKPAPITDEDIQIIREFVSESLESLEGVEVRLLDLDKDPRDQEAIHAIFRPFHTIKGISGFLNFSRINHLAHMVESLLDKARNSEILIDGQIIDLILASVDTLKKMIRSVEMTLNSASPTEGDADTRQVSEALERFISQTGTGKPRDNIPTRRRPVPEGDGEEASAKPRENQERPVEIPAREEKVEIRDQKSASPAAAYQVKVDTMKLDSIVDMVGELAIAQAMLRQNELIKGSADRKLSQITSQLSLIVSGLQSTAMSLRMIPIGSTFQKMLRLVRDLGKKSGKDVRLLLSGEDTEIDRSMVDEIYEPLVHMIRNSVDHGIETPEERERANKPRQGTIHLRAYYRGGDIVIEIEDDGRGLDRDKILQKGLSLGIIRESDKLSDREIDQLIFRPGFSTAEKVTDISGRGVGTDVVMSKVQKLRGRVDVRSRPGKGSTFVIHLPLTLAIIDGIIIQARGQRYIIPTLNVQESFRLQEKDVFTIEGKEQVIKVRDSLVPLLNLGRLLGTGGNGPGNGGGSGETLAVVVECQEKRRCFLVDDLLGKEEIVIKSLGGWLRNIPGIAGGAILGDGTVGLILDVAGLFALAG